MSTPQHDPALHPREQTGQFAIKPVPEAPGGFDAIADGRPTRLQDMAIPAFRPLLLPDYETGDKTFPMIELAADGSGGVVATGVIDLDLTGYARWRRDIAPRDEEAYAAHIAPVVADYLAANYGAQMDASNVQEVRAQFAVTLDPEVDDSSTIAPRLHAETGGDLMADHVRGGTFWENLHGYVEQPPAPEPAAPPIVGPVTGTFSVMGPEGPEKVQAAFFHNQVAGGWVSRWDEDGQCFRVTTPGGNERVYRAHVE